MKHIFLATLLAAALPAFAQTNAGSQSGSVASTENVNAPVFNLPAAPAITSGTLDQQLRTNQAATAATVFVNPPAADTCAKAGTAISAQAVGAGAAVSWGGGASDECEARADAISLKVTGAPAAVVKARQCQNPRVAQAFEDAGDPCPQRLRPTETRRAEAVLNDQPATASTTGDPYIAARLARRGG